MKLLTLLKSLQPDEHRDFEKFLQSPFFKASDQYLAFFKYLCKQHPTFDLQKADLQKAYQRCFGQESLTETKLYNLMSGLSKQLEQFLVVQMVMNPPETTFPCYDQLLIKSLGLRNMGAYFRAEAQSLIDRWDAIPIKDTDHQLALYQLHTLVYHNPDTPKFTEHPPHLQLALSQLDRYYLISRLRLVAEMKARERIFNVQYPVPFLEEILAQAAALDKEVHCPLLLIYRDLVNLYLHGVDESGYKALSLTFTKEIPHLPMADSKLLLRHLINCGISLDARNVAVETELLSLYKLAIEFDILMDRNRLTDSSFINIVNLAGRCKEYAWAWEFIRQFAPFLEEDKRQPSVDLATGSLHYAEGRLDEAQECLRFNIFQIPSLEIIGRTMLLKILADRYLLFDQDYEFLCSQIKAFERYLQLKQLREEKKAAYLNWARFLRQLVVTKFELVQVPSSRKASLGKKLEQLQPIISKKWLEDMLDGL